VLCIVNTHILADPGYLDVKLWQAHLLLRTLDQLQGLGGSTDKSMPLLVCGDFNSTPESAVYEYLRQGTVRSDHEDLRTDPCALLKNLKLGHSPACRRLMRRATGERHSIPITQRTSRVRWIIFGLLRTL